MRRLMTIVCVGVAASCATPVEERHFSADDYEIIYLFPEITIIGDNNTGTEKTKKVAQPRKQQVSLLNACSDISTGDLRRDISMKLECITEQVRYK